MMVVLFSFPYNQIRLNLSFISHLEKYGLLFYNSLLMLPVTVLIAYCTGDLTKSYEYPGWSSNPITGKSYLEFTYDKIIQPQRKLQVMNFSIKDMFCSNRYKSLRIKRKSTRRN